jgi:hypothetical protein
MQIHSGRGDVMVWLLAFEILLALIIIFVVLRWQSASLVGRGKISR